MLFSVLTCTDMPSEHFEHVKVLSVSTSSNKIVKTKDQGARLMVHQGLFRVEESLNGLRLVTKAKA